MKTHLEMKIICKKNHRISPKLAQFLKISPNNFTEYSVKRWNPTEINFTENIFTVIYPTEIYGIYVKDEGEEIRTSKAGKLIQVQKEMDKNNGGGNTGITSW